MSLIGRAFFSSDPGAPQLSGLVGSLSAVLDAILIDGYGAGESRTEPLGWSSANVAAGVRVYRNDPVLGNGNHIHVDDSGSGAASGREALLRGYVIWESGVGSFPFPSLAQLPAGVVWNKSSTAGALARQWVAFGNAATLYFFTDVLGNGLFPWFMGDIRSFSKFDRLSTMVGGFDTPGTTSGFLSRVLNQQRDLSASGWPSTSFCNFVASKSSIEAHSAPAMFGRSPLRSGLAANNNYGNNSGGSRVYPGIVSGGLDLERCIIATGAQVERGWAPGCYSPLHDRPLEHLTIYPGLGPEGGDIIAVNYRTQSQTSSPEGQILFELGVPW